jgi:hypothetical protein
MQDDAHDAAGNMEEHGKGLVMPAVTVVLLAVAALGLVVSFRCLPAICEMPSLGSGRYGQNWVGQGGWAFIAYTGFLLLAAYAAKRYLLGRFRTKGNAAGYFSLLVLLSLPYVWFLCDPDWFNPNIYRIDCWIGGPITVWFVPIISFVVDFCGKSPAKPWKHYLIRSGVEILIVFPIWAVFWSFFSFFVLGWGWI